MLNNLTKRIALYCCASTIATASMPDSNTHQVLIPTTQNVSLSKTQKTMTDALAATGMVMCLNPLIYASTTGTLYAHPRILWGGTTAMAMTVTPSVIATTAFTEMYTYYFGNQLNTFESCIVPAIGGFIGAYIIHPLDTLATWAHMDNTHGTRHMLKKAQQSKTFRYAGRNSLALREFLYSAGWAGLAPIGEKYFSHYYSDIQAKIASGIMAGTLMGILTTPVHNAKVEAQRLSLQEKDLPTNRAIYRELFKKRTLFNGVRFRIVLNIGAATWMSTIPNLIIQYTIPKS